MGRFDVFRKKKPDKKSAQIKHETQPRQQEQIREAKKGRKITRVKGWSKLPRRRKLLIILGSIGIGLALWFGIQSPGPPTPTYSLSVTMNPSGSGNVSPNYGNYSDGTQITLTATPVSGYEFTELTLDQFKHTKDSDLFCVWCYDLLIKTKEGHYYCPNEMCLFDEVIEVNEDD